MKITKFDITLLSVTVLILALFFCWNYQLSYQQIAQMQNKLNLFEAKADSVNLKPIEVQRLDLKIDKLEADLRKDYDLLLKVGLPVSLLALIGLFYGIYKTAYSFAIEEDRKSVV